MHPNEDFLGRAMSPPAQGPAAIQIPGPAARAAAKGSNNSGFFPNNKDTYSAPRPVVRKIGALHPGTLAAISGSGISPTELEFGNIRRINPDAQRDSDVTIWPSADSRTPSSAYEREKERLMREKAEKEMQAEKEKLERATAETYKERVERGVREMREKDRLQGTGTNESAMSGLSEYSWLNLGAQGK